MIFIFCPYQLDNKSTYWGLKRVLNCSFVYSILPASLFCWQKAWIFVIHTICFYPSCFHFKPTLEKKTKQAVICSAMHLKSPFQVSKILEIFHWEILAPLYAYRVKINLFFMILKIKCRTCLIVFFITQDICWLLFSWFC